MQQLDVVVIGAGQAGLSAAYHLRQRGGISFVVLDADRAPGGAWQHRWDSLLMGTVNGIHELPGHPVPPAPSDAPSREVLPAYFEDYEQRFSLPVLRPVRVRSVRRADADPHGRLVVTGRVSGAAAAPGETSGAPTRPAQREWSARYVVNATGTWNAPFLPYYPGRRSFRGRQLHVAQYRSAEEFAGKRVVIVGGGISAVQLLEEISRVADTLWVTRREVVFEDGPFDEAARIAAVSGVAERAALGLQPASVVSATGQYWSPWAVAARDRGVLVQHPMFTAIEPDGVRMPDGRLEPADVILWATGFRPAINHLAPLGLRTPEGGIRVVNGRSVDEPRLFLIGYGPSQSTIGANRAGAAAARTIRRELQA